MSTEYPYAWGQEEWTTYWTDNGLQLVRTNAAPTVVRTEIIPAVVEQRWIDWGAPLRCWTPPRPAVWQQQEPYLKLLNPNEPYTGNRLTDESIAEDTDAWWRVRDKFYERWGGLIEPQIFSIYRVVPNPTAEAHHANYLRELNGVPERETFFRGTNCSCDGTGYHLRSWFGLCTQSCGFCAAIRTNFHSSRRTPLGRFVCSYYSSDADRYCTSRTTAYKFMIVCDAVLYPNATCPWNAELSAGDAYFRNVDAVVPAFVIVYQ